MQSSQRLVAIDILRGLVIALMTLDHVRDYFAVTGFNPLDLEKTTPAWFWTRWITHLCAPSFVLLAGCSAFLRSQKVSLKELSRFLFSRGLLLVVLEFTWISFSWQFDMSHLFIQVIWVLGVSMMVLSALIYLPRKWIA